MKIANLKSGLGVCLFFTLLAGTAVPSSGQSTPGVSESEILIGSCSALEGPSHFLGVETVTGAKAYFSLINDEGGVNGRKLKLISADDSYDPAKTQACFDHLMSEKVFALGFFVGTPTAVKYVPMADSAKIPLVGLFTGAQTLYVPLRHWIVNVRASYFDETREQVERALENARLQEDWRHLSRGCVWNHRSGRRESRAQGTWRGAGSRGVLSAADGASGWSDRHCARREPGCSRRRGTGKHCRAHSEASSRQGLEASLSDGLVRRHG